MQLSTIFQLCYVVAVSFIGGETQSIKSQTRLSPGDPYLKQHDGNEIIEMDEDGYDTGGRPKENEFVGRVRVMLFNVTFNNISVMLCCGGQFDWWRNPEYPEKTTDLLQVTDNYIHIL
jgi:hypothetical protein